jgi:hypothetical protein
MSSKGHLTNFTPADFAAFGKSPPAKPPAANPGPTSKPGTDAADEVQSDVEFANVDKGAKGKGSTE